jgi:histidinol-phosphate aminotransferase
MIPLENLLRENIKKLIPYSSARNEYKGDASVFLDANENPFNAPVNRYPDPLQVALKEQIAGIKKIDTGSIFLGNGSDEAIDLIIRAFCEPGRDNIVSIDPTYGMYKVCADINNVEFRKALLTDSFDLNVDALSAKTDQQTKIIFLCSPNNPTSNSFLRKDIEKVIRSFDGIVVLDEAYIDFSKEEGFLPYLSQYPNLIILQTLSKAWGLAGIRLGMAFSDRAVIEVLNKIKYPYNINVLTLQTAVKSLKNTQGKEQWVSTIMDQRKMLEDRLLSFPFVLKVYPSDANFLLIKADQARNIYEYLVSCGIIIRDRSGSSLCDSCLRITVGTADENIRLLEALEGFQYNRL